MPQFLVFLVVVEWDARNPIVDLVAKGISGVVDYEYFFEVSLADDPQILDENAVFCLDAMVSEEPMGNEFPIWVQVVQNNGTIAGMGGSEDDDLKVLAELLQTLPCKRPDVDICLVS